jgi:hypothetical protein
MSPKANCRQCETRFAALLCLSTCAVAAPQPARHVMSQFARLPLSFVQHGDAPDAYYAANASGYAIRLDPRGARAAIRGTGKGGTVLSMEFAGGRNPTAHASEKLPSKANYIFGQDRRQWQLGLATYGRVNLRESLPGHRCGILRHPATDGVRSSRETGARGRRSCSR